MSAGGAKPKKLVLTVIDAMKPAMLERAVTTGRAPALKLLIERGTLVDNSVAAFPSVTPVCAASIATGVGPDRHEIPSMNWYHRGEGRYVEYGTSFKASQTFGFKRSLTDTIYNMNLEHLSSSVETVFEVLDDADVRTAGTLPLYAEGAALAAAGVSVLFPPLAILVIAGLIALLVGGRRRSGEKYAGLRILR